MNENDWSVPETDVFDRVRTALDERTEAVLATVVDVDGSAYRRPGAKMLVDPAGVGAGSITAGCVEDEVRQLALEVLDDGEPRVETWDLTGDDDVWGMGVGCNGVVTVLLEPLDDSYRPVVDAVERGDDVGVVTAVGGDVATGARTCYDPGEGFADGDLPDWVLADLEDVTETLVAEGKADTVRVEGEGRTAEVFVDGVQAPPNLVVFGSGHDVAPVVELAKLVDFHVTVVSYRGARSAPEDFPRADEVVSGSARDAADLVDFDDDTYVVVMTHNFLDDRMTLDGLLSTPVPYVGLMGPRERFEQMLDDFADEGVTVEQSDLDRIHTPVGLNLGGDSPYQIAYSIVAELLAVANDRTPQHLSEREGPIHERLEL
ncbi:XdhC family protein [Haloarchaeobius sp. HRN-SO-5]|uniref:XdhC family protein n=1 Tax=Haloarchaeobius sp. HRN-SO-5 TaxID=3446118 RepID=UPI003EB969AD